MWKIGNMIWRIGQLLDFDEQLAWVRAAGFGGVGFHASAGIPGEWTGIDPTACNAKERKSLRQKIGNFSFSEVHAPLHPLKIELQTESLSSGLAALKPVLKFAGDAGATLLTVHAQVPPSAAQSDLNKWPGPMRQLNADAVRMKTMIVLEIVDGFDAVKNWGLSNIGVNLDVGHMYLSPNLKNFGGFGNLIRCLGNTLRHLHLHDVVGDVDHNEIGTGSIPFEEIAVALKDISYQGGMCLELNPDRVAPAGIRRSKEYLENCFRAAGGG